MMRRATLGMLVAAALAGGAEVQAQSPLPPGMVAAFGAERTWAEDLWLPTDPGDEVRARLTFSNGATNRIDIAWQFFKAGAATRTSSQSVDVSFRPTSVARRAGTTMTFYVVGWSERTGRVLVEEWTFDQFVLGSSMPAGGGTPISVFGQPAIQRTVEWISESGSLTPIWDAVCNPLANALLLLDSGATTRVWSLDLGTHALTELYSSASQPALAGHRMLTAARHGAGGFVAFTQRRKPWEHADRYQAPADFFVLRDTNADGQFDVQETVANDAFYVRFPPPWNLKYQQ